MFDSANSKESEEYHKALIRDFLKETGFSDYFINTKGRNDLVVHTENSPESEVGIIIETKRPGINPEMPTITDLNRKAMQELLLYFLRERYTNKNTDIKHLIVTDLYKWFIIDAREFQKITDNTQIKKKFEDFESGRLVFDKTKSFYDEIAAPALESVKNTLKFTFFNIRDYKKYLEKQSRESDKKLIGLYKILSPVHLLRQRFANDSNTLNKNFYNELLHIIGLEEYKQKSKKLIRRKTKANRNQDSLIESVITEITSLGSLPQVKDIERFGENEQQQLYNTALELVITWINRILFLKLLESQIAEYIGSKNYRFLNSEKVADYDDLNTLFFKVLAVQADKRRDSINKQFPDVPYLNSSLFDPTELEKQAVYISNLPNNTNLPLYKKTVVKTKKDSLNTLDYLFRFLDAYDFSSEGKEDITDEHKTLINASVLGLIFEKINGYKDGSFFTPGFITMYMSRQTIRRAVVQKFREQTDFDSEHFGDLVNFTKGTYKESQLQNYNEIVNSLKVCDPAVGSGHFLVSALNEIIAVKSELGILIDENRKKLGQYLIDVENDELVILDETGEFFKYDPNNRESRRVQKTLFHEKQIIIENCLFGVDINHNSVEICRLRLWIELLKNAYYKQNGELETLPNIDINIKCGNSLISRYSLESDLKEVLSESRFSIDAYRTAVMTYRNAENKKQKHQMIKLINEIKETFSQSIDLHHPKRRKLTKLRGKYIALVDQKELFQTENKKSKLKKIDKLSREIKKAENEVQQLKSGAVYRNAFEWRFEFPEVLDEKTGTFNGFDIVIGNPPYIKENDDKAVFNGLRDLEVYQGKMDIWYLFCSLGLDLLKNNDYLSFIATNNWTTNYGAKKLRNKITKTSKILKLIDFNTFKVFDEASIQTMILMLKKDNQSNNYNFDYRKVIDSNNKIKPTDILCNKNRVNTNKARLINAKFRRNDMIDESFTFCNEKISKALYRISKKGNYFLKPQEEIAQGIVFPQDYLNNKTQKKLGNQFERGQGVFVLSDVELKELSLSDKERKGLIRPYYTSKQLHKYSANPENQEWIIYTKSNFKRPESIEPYPNIKRHLDKFEKIITSDNKPYGLHRARNEKFFKGEKIITIRKCPKEPVFTYTDFDCYVSAAFYIIKTDKVNLKYLTALLNSRLVKFWLNYKGKKQGSNFQVDAEPLSKIPLISIPASQQKPFIELFDKILSKKKKGQDTAAEQAEIDRLVYNLYGLTEEEKAIIEKDLD
jgi:hypothetical protein